MAKNHKYGPQITLGQEAQKAAWPQQPRRQSWTASPSTL